MIVLFLGCLNLRALELSCVQMRYHAESMRRLKTRHKLKGSFTYYKTTTVINSTSKITELSLEQEAFGGEQRQFHHQHAHSNPTAATGIEAQVCSGVRLSSDPPQK